MHPMYSILSIFPFIHHLLSSISTDVARLFSALMKVLVAICRRFSDRIWVVLGLSLCLRPNGSGTLISFTFALSSRHVHCFNPSDQSWVNPVSFNTTMGLWRVSNASDALVREAFLA